MDIRAYYRKVQEVESNIATSWVVVVSLQTQEGGKAGHTIEVSRDVAAKLIVENRARFATEVEAQEYRTEMERLRAEAEQARMAAKVQIAVMSEESIRQLKTGSRTKG